MRRVVVGRVLGLARMEAGVTQVELSRWQGRPQSTISKIERGKVTPLVEHLESYAGLLGLQAWQLLQAAEIIDARVQAGLAYHALRAAVDAAWSIHRQEGQGMNHDLIICYRCGRRVSPSPSGDGSPVPHYLADRVDPCVDCACLLPQPGWSTGRCSTCAGFVSYEVWTSGYPGRPGHPRSDEEITTAIRLARLVPPAYLPV